MPMRNTLRCLLLLGVACSGEPGASPLNGDSELQLAYLRLGMSEPQAAACAALATRTHGEQAPGVLATDAPSSDPLQLTRASFLQAYCDDYSPAGNETGWEACIAESSLLTPRVATAQCMAQVESYLECLARSDALTREDCRAVQPPSGCDPTVPVRTGGAESLWCAVGQFGLEQLDCDPGPAYQQCVAHEQVLTDCPDGSSYGLRCLPPAGSCNTSCSCAVDGIPLGQVTVPVHDADFVSSAWAACGFPAIPAELRDRWRAQASTTSVFDQAP